MTLDLSIIADMPILSGSHESRDEGVCIMEAVAWVAGEPHTDHPVCVCPIISGFLRSWNDSIPDDKTRTRLLKPLVPLTIGTVADQATQDRRSFLCMDWIVREFTPTWMECSESLKVHAAALRSLPEIMTWEGLIAATPVLVDAAKQSAAAWGAARGAARGAAWDAAWDAARGAARGAAWGAAWGAARAAAWDAARAALKPTTSKLQDSAVELVKRMCAARPQSPTL